MSDFLRYANRIAYVALVGSIALLAGTSAVQATTAFKAGEVTTGMSKQCIYNGLGSKYTLTIAAASLCPLTVEVPSIPANNSAPPAQQSGGVAFKTGEVVTGLTKQCFYNYLGSQVTRTISSVALCPLSIPMGN